MLRSAWTEPFLNSDRCVGPIDRTGLNRNGKSCRLRWLNYLRPGVRRGGITPAEDAAIRELHAALGNKWSKIAAHLPGRTDNEIKNYWRTRIQRRPAAPASSAQQPYRAPATATATAAAMAASEGASSSSSAAASHGSSAAGDWWSYSYVGPNHPEQGAHRSQKSKSVAAAAAAAGVDSGSASSALTSRDSSTTAGVDGQHQHMQTSYGDRYYYSELSSAAAADGVEMVDAGSFWNVDDDFWGRFQMLHYPDS